VERLLTANANVNAATTPDYRGRLALQAAAERGHLDVVVRGRLDSESAVKEPKWEGSIKCY